MWCHVPSREQRSAQHGDIWKTNILGSPTIMVFGEAECRKLLKEEGHLVEVLWPDVTAELVMSHGLYVPSMLLQSRPKHQCWPDLTAEPVHCLL